MTHWSAQRANEHATTPFATGGHAAHEGPHRVTSVSLAHSDPQAWVPGGQAQVWFEQIVGGWHSLPVEHPGTHLRSDGLQRKPRGHPVTAQSLGRGAQLPATQRSVLPHVRPQLPQLSWSVCTSTQALPHGTSGAMHATEASCELPPPDAPPPLWPPAVPPDEPVPPAPPSIEPPSFPEPPSVPGNAVPRRSRHPHTMRSQHARLTSRRVSLAAGDRSTMRRVDATDLWLRVDGNPSGCGGTGARRGSADDAGG